MPDLFDGAEPGATTDEKPAGESSTPAGATADSPPGDGKGASSAPAADKRPASSFEHVMALSKKQAEKPDGAEAKPEGDSPAPDGKDKDAAEVAGDEPGAKVEAKPEKPEDYEPVQRPRSHAERRLNALLEERKGYIGKAQVLDQLQEWNRSMGQTEEQFVAGMNLMSLMNPKSPSYNPKKALELADPILKQLRQDVGIVDALPDDLQADVTEGRMSEDKAREFAAARLRNASLERQLATKTEQTEADREAKRHSDVERTFRDFDAQQAKSDPDWNKKRADVGVMLRSMWLTEPPSTPEVAHRQAKKALETVNERWKELRGNKPHIDPPRVNSGSNPKVAVRPKSSLEAGNAALAGQPIQY